MIRYGQPDPFDLNYVTGFLDEYGQELELPKYEPITAELIEEFNSSKTTKKDFANSPMVGKMSAQQTNFSLAL